MLERLKEIRIAAGLTQAEIALRVGVDRQTYMRWEKRERAPKTSMLARIAAALDVAPDQLVTPSTPPTDIPRREEKLTPGQLGDRIYDLVITHRQPPVKDPAEMVELRKACYRLALGDL